MIVKRIILVVLFFLLGVSCLQLFNVPPYAGDIKPLYRSGYFDELDRGFDIIRDTFLSLKTLDRIEYGWIFLTEIEEKQGIRTGLFDSRGFEVAAPGIRSEKPDRFVADMISESGGERKSSVSDSRYMSLIPVTFRGECLICHRNSSSGQTAGYLVFERNSDPFIYYSSERIILFSVISIVIVVLILITARWDPVVVKDLFDK